MRIERIGRHTLEIYNSVDDMPVDRFAAYNLMLLVDSGLGSDLEAIDIHLSKIQQYMNSGKNKEAQQELLNMRNAFYFVIENLSPKHLSFCALVHSIDGRRVTDYSEENLKRMLDQFAQWGASRGMIDGAVEAVKKKLSKSLKIFSRRSLKAQNKKKPPGK